MKPVAASKMAKHQQRAPTANNGLGTGAASHFENVPISNTFCNIPLPLKVFQLLEHLPLRHPIWVDTLVVLLTPLEGGKMLGCGVKTKNLMD